MARRKPPALPTPAGLRRRSTRAYYVREFPQAVGGDRISKSLEAEWGSELAGTHLAAVNTLWDRGDWSVLRRWQAGEIHISEFVRAAREGSWERLKRLNVDGYLLGKAVEEHVARTAATRRASTSEGHRLACAALVDHFGADRPMHTITKTEAEEFLHAPKKKNRNQPWAPSTQELTRIRAGALWRYAIEREAEEAKLRAAVPTLTASPWAKAETHKIERVRPGVLIAEEIADMLTHPATAGTPRAAYLGCGAYAGLRQSETRHLRTTEDIDIWPEAEWTVWEAGVIHIQSRKGVGEWYTKTENSERGVPITPALAMLILDHMRHGYAGTRYLFRTPGRDQPIARATSNTWTRAAFEAVEIRYGQEGDGLTYHNLRHSYATLLLSEGVSIAAVAELLGDTQEVVLSTYSHALPSDRERALKILARISAMEAQ